MQTQESSRRQVCESHPSHAQVAQAARPKMAPGNQFNAPPRFPATETGPLGDRISTANDGGRRLPQSLREPSTEAKQNNVISTHAGKQSAGVSHSVAPSLQNLHMRIQSFRKHVADLPPPPASHDRYSEPSDCLLEDQLPFVCPPGMFPFLRLRRLHETA